MVFRLHADRAAFSGLPDEQVVEAGLIEVDIGSSSANLRLHGELELGGPERAVGAGRVLSTPVAVLDGLWHAETFRWAAGARCDAA